MKILSEKPFSNLDRVPRIQQAAEEVFDLIIIGGGITGAGIALDASLRGLKILLVEKNDFASGTSSKSTKLIHGGLRYLKQLEFGLVRETGLERSIAHENICHLIHPETMLLPIVDGGTFNLFSAGLAIQVYDFLADVSSSQKRKKLNKSQVLEMEPNLTTDGLNSGIAYAEYRTDDARLTIELVKSARRQGAEAFNHMPVEDFLYEGGKVNGIVCKDMLSEKTHSFKAKMVVSSTGPWVDKVRLMDQNTAKQNLHLSKGVHIVVSAEKLPIKHALYFDAFDGRMIFSIPREGVVYIGTTDTTFKGKPEDLYCTEEDANYLLKAVNHMFDVPEITLEDIESTWTGLRPLIQKPGRSASELSRKDEIFISDTGLISIAGGKLTGFRKMAKRIVDLVLKKLPEKAFVPCKTKRFNIHADPFDSYHAYKTFAQTLYHESKEQGLTEFQATYLTTTYGKHAVPIIDSAISQEEGALETRLVKAQLDFCTQYESVYYPSDFFERRTGWLYFQVHHLRKHLPTIIGELSHVFTWDADTQTSMFAKSEQHIQKNMVQKTIDTITTN